MIIEVVVALAIVLGLSAEGLLDRPTGGLGEGAAVEAADFDWEFVPTADDDTWWERVSLRFDFADAIDFAAEFKFQPMPELSPFVPRSDDEGIVVIAICCTVHRRGAALERLIRSNGGNDETEAAVAKALRWLASQQNNDGSWSAGESKDSVGATALALRPFLLACGPSGKRCIYSQNVERGIAFLISRMKPNGRFGNADMRTQAWATAVLCDYYRLTSYFRRGEFAQRAVDYVVQSQQEDGSWHRWPQAGGDVVTICWQFDALKAAVRARLDVPKSTFQNAIGYISGCSMNDGADYGRSLRGSDRTATAAALLIRQMDGWTPRNPALCRGMKNLNDLHPPGNKDIDFVYVYFATRAMHAFAGPEWHTRLNPALQKMMLDMQLTEKRIGGWGRQLGVFPAYDKELTRDYGLVGNTALACEILEVYYRMPMYHRNNGLSIIDK